MWDEITFHFPNFNGATIEVWEWISNFIPPFTGYVITYFCWEYELICVDKRDPGEQPWSIRVNYSNELVNCNNETTDKQSMPQHACFGIYCVYQPDGRFNRDIVFVEW